MAFHEPAWASTLAAAYGHRSFALALADGKGKITAGMPMIEITGVRGSRWASLPFSDVCPPIGDVSEVSELVRLIDAEIQAGRIRGAEIRAPLPSPAATASVGVIHELELREDANELFTTFSKSQVQRNIARARREGVVVRRGRHEAELLETFLSLHLATRRRQGVPTQPSSFFKCLWDYMIAPGHGFVLVAEVDRTPAAAAVFLVGGRRLTYKYGASDPAYWPKRPNHMLFWEAIRWGCEGGYHLLDFGRSDYPNTGLRSFKSGWGTAERDLVYSWLGKASGHARGGAALLEPVIRYSPMVVNRLLGRLFYRFAA